MAKYVHIHGRKYDVSGFDHPGGRRILSSYIDRDASLVYEMFHTRSRQKASRYLKSLPSEASELTPNEIERNFEEFRRQLQAEGMFDPRPFDIIWRTTIAIALMYGGISYCTTRYFLGACIAALGYQQMGWIEHECGHGSFMGSPRFQKTIQWIIFDFVLGGSHRFWNYQHSNHHANTQHIVHDLDLDTHPLFCHSYKKFRHDGLKSNCVLKISGWMWPIMNVLVFFAWSLFIHPRYEIRKGNLKYLPMQICFMYLKSSIISMITGFTMIESFALCILISAVGLSILLTVFVVSHVPTEANTTTMDLVTTTSRHTINIRPNFLVNWFMGYLNLQIEHHLFTTMPQVNHLKIRARVKQFFVSHGLEYKEFGFCEAYAMVFRHMFHVSKAIESKGYD